MLRGVTVALVVALALAHTAPARAWTETRVEGMRAHLDVDAEGDALIALRVPLHVLGGWLSRFEMHGLMPGLVLDRDKRPWLRAEKGEKYFPKVEQDDDGVLRFDFGRRKTAPRRGRYDLGIVYRATLPLQDTDAGGFRRARFALPAWPIGLGDVRVEVVAPAGSRAVEASGLSERAAVSLREHTHGGLAFFEFRRVQLPRTVTWALDIDLAQPGSTGPASDTPQLASQGPWLPDLHALLAALLLAALALLKVAALVQPQRARPRFLIALPLWLRRTTIVASAILSGAFYAEYRDAATALLALGAALAVRRSAAPRTQRTRAADRRASDLDLARARRARTNDLFGLRSWLDVSTPAGAALACSAWVLVILALRLGADPEPFVTAALLLSVLLFTGTRVQEPPNGAAALLRLWRVHGRLAAAGIDAELRVHGRLADGMLEAPALRLRPPAPPKGLAQAEIRVAPGDVGDAGPGFILSLDTLVDSAADRLATRALIDAATHARGARRIRTALTAEPCADVRALWAWLSQDRRKVRLAA